MKRTNKHIAKRLATIGLASAMMVGGIAYTPINEIQVQAARFKARMKQLTSRSWGSNSYKLGKLNRLIRGWINYFKIGSMKTLCAKLFKLPTCSINIL